MVLIAEFHCIFNVMRIEKASYLSLMNEDKHKSTQQNSLQHNSLILGNSHHLTSFQGIFAPHFMVNMVPKVPNLV